MAKVKQDISKAAVPGESETVEWKQSLGEWREIVETCAAFATANGGTVYVGISPSSERTGVKIGQGTLEDLANKIKVNTDPPQFPSIEIHGPEQSAEIRIHIEPNPVKPVWAFGRPVKRVGRTNQFLRRDEAQRLLEVSTGRTWDSLACKDFHARDVSHDAVRDFLDRAGMKKSTPLGDVMRNLRFGDETRFCNAAVLLFGKFPQRFFVEAKLKCARFIGGSQVDFLDERTIEGGMLRQLDEAMTFVTRNTRQALKITGKPQHDVVPEYPEQAVREAIINALCHRNYTEVGTIQVRIHDDRLEVWNPGALPYGLSVAELYRPHASHPRNPLIATALFRTRLIEQWGTGTLRIIEACRPRNIKVEFEIAMGMFIVRLRQQGMPDSQAGGAVATIPGRVTPQVAPHETPQVTPQVLRLLGVMKGIADRDTLQSALGLKARKNFRLLYLAPALLAGLVEMTIPNKPKSRLQKYRLAAKGRALVESGNGRIRKR